MTAVTVDLVPLSSIDEQKRKKRIGYTVTSFVGALRYRPESCGSET
jgi:hypothetical protein